MLFQTEMEAAFDGWGSFHHIFIVILHGKTATFLYPKENQFLKESFELTFREDWVMMTAVAVLSNCGLPARPIICRIWAEEYSWPLLPATICVVDFIMTKWAGRLTPSAGTTDISFETFDSKLETNFLTQKIVYNNIVRICLKGNKQQQNNSQKKYSCRFSGKSLVTWKMAHFLISERWD